MVPHAERASNAVYHSSPRSLGRSRPDEHELRELEQFGEDLRLLRWLLVPETVVQRHKTLLSVYARLAGLALSQTVAEQFLTRTEANIASKPKMKQTRDEQEVLTEIQRIRHLWATGDSVMSQLPAGGEHDETWQMLDGIIQFRHSFGQDLDKAKVIAREVYETAQARHNLLSC
jgi:hypothetical protein